MSSRDRSANAATAWVWAILSVVWWFASLALALPLGSLMPDRGAGLRWDLAVVLAVNGALSLAGVWILGGGLLRQPLRHPSTGLAMPVLGIGVAIAEELALHAWAEARFGYYDSELVWWTGVLSPMLMLVAVASFGILVAPRDSIVPPLAGLCLAIVGVVFILLSNVPGLADGVDPGSGPLAVLLAAPGAYAVGAGLIGVWHARVVNAL